MSKSFIKSEVLRRLSLLQRLETGFSMLEAVVVVGVLLALAVTGFFAYGPIVENAKIAKVKSVASEIHTGVMAANIDGDTTTNPQSVIDNWNKSTDKIKVEILASAAVTPATSSTGTAPSAEEDFCVQATNVENPNIKAREGACSDVISGSGSDSSTPTPTPTPTSTPAPDTDGDGIPDATDPDIDGNGVPNTPWESYSIVKDQQKIGTEVSYTNADGSKTTWNYTDTKTYNHEHNPIAPHLLPSGKFDILRIARPSAGTIVITVGTDGSMSNSTGAVGGSFSVFNHIDISCKDNTTGVVAYRYAQGAATLKGLYLQVTGSPGPNTGSYTINCRTNETMVGTTVYPDRYVDYSNNYYGGYSYWFTKNQIINWSPAGG